VSISPTFYKQLFMQKCFAQLFSTGFVVFWKKTMGEKAARKMLVTLTTAQPDKIAPDPLQPGVNFTNVL